MFFPLGDRRLREDAGLHWHIVLDNDFLAANWLADGTESMAHNGDDGDLHWSFSQLAGRKIVLSLCGHYLNKSQPAPSPLNRLLRDVPALSWGFCEPSVVADRRSSVTMASLAGSRLKIQTGDE
jgi:hypothetical protein